MQHFLPALLAGILALGSCNSGGPVVVTASGGDIVGIDGVLLDTPAASAPIAGREQRPGSWGSKAYVLTETVTVADTKVLKESTFEIHGGKITFLQTTFKPGSESQAKKVGAAVLAGLKSEYRKVETFPFGAIVKDSNGDVLNFDSAPDAVSITVKHDS